MPSFCFILLLPTAPALTLTPAPVPPVSEPNLLKIPIAVSLDRNLRPTLLYADRRLHAKRIPAAEHLTALPWISTVGPTRLDQISGCADRQRSCPVFCQRPWP